MSDIDVLRKIEIELRDKIARLESEIARLRAELEAAKALVKRHEDALWNIRMMAKTLVKRHEDALWNIRMLLIDAEIKEEK